jgi:alkylhydroperoxidase family enzyme
VLVRHTKLFKRWLPFGGTLLIRGRLPARDRELVILRIAWLCQGRVEWAEHVDIAHRSDITTEEVERVVAGPDAPGWDPFDRLLVRAVDELRTDGSISDDTWSGLAERYDEQQLIELPILVGQYHLVAWTQNSLGMGPAENLATR